MNYDFITLSQGEINLTCQTKGQSKEGQRYCGPDMDNYKMS